MLARWLSIIAMLAMCLPVTAVPPTLTDTPDQATNEDAAKEVGVVVNDDTTPAADLVLTGTSNNTALVPNDSIAFGGSGTARTVTLTPATDQFGTTTITLTVTDGDLESTSDTFVLTVAALNDADNDSYIINEDTILSKDAASGVLANDNDVPGHTLIAIYDSAVDTVPAHGTLSLAADGSFTYRPVKDYYGTDSFTYRVEVDNNPATHDTGVVSIHVNPVNDPPVATNLSTSMMMNQKRSLTLRATDVDNTPGELTYTIVSQPANGTLSGTAPDFTYEPDTGFAGADSFTYKANDGFADSAAATVRITVRIIKEPADESVLDCRLGALPPTWPTFWGSLLPLLVVFAGLAWHRARCRAARR